MAFPARNGQRGILFDVDGTLSDSSFLCFEATVAVLEKNGYSPIQMADFHEGTRYTTPARFSWHVTGRTDDPIGKLLGKEFDDMYVKLVSPDTAAFYDGIKDMLGNIASSYPQAVYGALSNACGAYVRRVCTINECSNDFKVQLGADEVSQPKPFPDGLLQCASSLAIEPSSCLYIGDSPTDGQAAKAAGMRSIGVTWGSHPSQSVESAFDVTVHDVPSLERAIRDILES